MAIPKRSVSRVSRPAAAKRSDLVNTATLIRGRMYSWRHKTLATMEPIQFKSRIPVVIEDDKILALLEDEIEEVGDGEGEFYEKPRFSIKRGVPRPVDETVTARRLSSERVVRTRPRHEEEQMDYED